MEAKEKIPHQGKKREIGRASRASPTGKGKKNQPVRQKAAESSSRPEERGLA